MSTVIISACWPLQMPPTAKAVLISLADNANDDGYCWPSLTKIAERTCFSRTAVIDAIKWLESNGALKADRKDRYRTTYVVTPRAYKGECAHKSGRRTSTDGGALVRLPDNEVRETDDEVRQPDTNRQEPSRTVSKATVSKRVTAPDRPDRVTVEVWADWLTLRKAKKAPVTETVLKSAIREADKAGLTLNRFLEIWCARGSQGLEADWLKPNERNQTTNGTHNAAAKLTPAERIAVNIARDNGGQIPAGYEGNRNVVAALGGDLRPQVDERLRGHGNGFGGADLGQGIKWLNGDPGR